MRTDPYAPHAAFCAPARGVAEFWRTAAGLVLGISLYFALAQGFVALVLALAPEAATTGTAAHALVRLMSVGLVAASTCIVAVALHTRRPGTLLGDLSQALRDFRRVLMPLAALIAVTYAIQSLSMEATPLPARNIGSWLVLLPVGLLAILIQAGSEEVVFRGYLQQQLAARLNLPVLWLGLPSAFFAVVHYAPSIYGGNAAMIALWAGAFGLAMADLTARTGTLGAAIAVHFTMNAWSILGIALPGPLVGLALYVLPFGASEEAPIRSLLPGEFLHILLAWLTARLALRV